MPDLLQKYRFNASSLQVLANPKEFFEYISQGKMLHELFGFRSDVMLDFYEAATRILNEGRYADAYDAFYFLVTIAPKVSEFWRGLAFACMEQQDFDNAIANCQQAIDCDPESVDAYLTAIRIYCKMRDFERADRLIDETIEFAKENPHIDWADELHQAMIGAQEFVKKTSRGH